MKRTRRIVPRVTALAFALWLPRSLAAQRPDGCAAGEDSVRALVKRFQPAALAPAVAGGRPTVVFVQVDGRGRVGKSWMREIGRTERVDVDAEVRRRLPEERANPVGCSAMVFLRGDPTTRSDDFVLGVMFRLVNDPTP